MLDDLATFERVVRLGSFTAAARALGRSKSSVSAQVARLEDVLATRLLERTTRQIRLTQAGRAVLDHCQRMVAEADAARGAAASAQREPSGILRLTAPTLLGESMVGPLLVAFLRRHPRVRAELRLTEDNVDLVAEGMDLAIRIMPRSSALLRMRVLGTARSIFVASPSYLQARGTPRTAADLRRHDAVVVGDGLGERWPVARRGSVALDGARVCANSLTVGLHFAVQGLGVAWLPAFLCQPHLQRGELRQILQPLTPPAYTVGAVWPAQKHPLPRTRAFVALLLEHTARRAPWDAGRV